MKKIIDPVDKEILKKELTNDKLLRTTNALHNYIYLVNNNDSPNVVREIGRLREYTFRTAGGGTGEEVDIDAYDIGEKPFKQLIVWNREEEEIVSAYRYIMGKDAPTDENGYPLTPTSKLFWFSPKFIQEQWMHTIELGRSFVQPKYQAGGSSRIGLFSLDNIWDGLGALVVDNPDIQYFFGKMTMYNSYNRIARNMILHFLNKHFKGDENLVHPFVSSEVDNGREAFKSLFPVGSTLKENFKILNKNILDLKSNIPPLIKSYVSISPTLQFYGASPNVEFGPVEEIAILINIADIYESKKERHIYSYVKKSR